MKGMWTESGLEAESNDGKIKYILRKVVNLSEDTGMEQSVYNSSVFAKNGASSWAQSVNSGASYSSLQDFLNQISRIVELSTAYRELIETKSNEVQSNQAHGC